MTDPSPIVATGAASAASAAIMAALHAQVAQPRTGRAWGVDEYTQLLATPGTFGLIAGDGAGFILFRQATGEIDILMMAVRPDMRRRGIGGGLLDAARAHAIATGVRRIVLEVAVDNVAATALYRSRGFIEVARCPGYYVHGVAGAVDASVMTHVTAMAPTDRTFYSRGAEDQGRGRAMTSRIERLCESKGLRMTDQRRVIARVLSDADDHPDVELLYQRAAGVDPRISIATVYRTVRLFEEANILTKHEFGDGRARYEEAAGAHHDHLIDTRSGKVIEFQNDAIERLQEAVARELGYRLVGHRLELYGVPLAGRAAQDRK